jgi:hypothetical protein
VTARVCGPALRGSAHFDDNAAGGRPFAAERGAMAARGHRISHEGVAGVLRAAGYSGVQE